MITTNPRTMLRYKVLDEDGETLRILGSKEECEVYKRTGCKVVVLPRPKPVNRYLVALTKVGEAPF